MKTILEKILNKYQNICLFRYSNPFKMSQLDESPDTGVKSEKNVERPSSIIIGYEVQIPKK